MWRDDNAPRLAASAPAVTADEREAWRTTSRTMPPVVTVAEPQGRAAANPDRIAIWQRALRRAPSKRN